MTAPSVEERRGWQGRTMEDREGKRIGDIRDIYLDNKTDQPEWAVVNTGMFGTRVSFVPLTEATERGDQIHVPYSKDQVKDAPNIEPDGELSVEEEAELYEHYGLEYGPMAGTGRAGTAERADIPPGRVPRAGEREAGPEADEAMTRSEEEVRFGTRERERGHVRLRKHVTEETVTKTVPVRHEEARVEREPIDATAATGTEAELSEEEQEVTLHEEEPVVEKRTVPKERVRLGKEAVTEERQVSERVRKEEIEVEDEEGEGGLPGQGRRGESI